MTAPDPAPAPQQAGTLKQGIPGRALTPEERRQGGLTRQANLRLLKEEARRVAAERLADSLVPALDRVDATIADDDEKPLALKAALAVIEHNVGKPIQGVEHTGANQEPIVVEHQWRLTLDDLAAFAAQLRQGPQPRLSGELPAALPVLPAPEPD